MLLLFLLPLLVASPSSAASPAACPLDLSYVSTFPWDPSSCQAPMANVSSCCQTLLSVFGIGIAVRLRSTGMFRLPSAASSAACLLDFAGEIAKQPKSLSSSLVSTCFPDDTAFAISRDFCAGVENVTEFAAAVSADSLRNLNASCSSGLDTFPRCSGCFSAGSQVSSDLTRSDGNNSNSLHCFYLSVVYAAGVSSLGGPMDTDTASCVLGLPLLPPPKNNSDGNNEVNWTLVIAVVVPTVFIVLAVAVSILWYRKRRQNGLSLSVSKMPSNELVRKRSLISPRSHPRPNTGSVLFGIEELANATDNFKQENIIGRGGFGVVFKGTLADGSDVAVKKMLDPDIEGGDEEFTNEVQIISHLRHRNLVPLRGCCITDDDNEEGKQRFLVYDYMPNGSLEQCIFGTESLRRPVLSWPQRRNIILDVARGIEYLHYGVKPAIFHRDIKATNVLLDGEMRARLADFGLARRSREGQSHLTTRVAGTHGYLAPEYALYGQLTEKSDVYSFGVLVLEVLSGRHALDTTSSSGVVLVTDWAWGLAKAGRTREVLDEAMFVIGDSPRGSPRGGMERFVLVGILCAHVMVALRPTIVEALRMLEGNMEIPEIQDRPMPLGHGLMYGDTGSNLSVSPAYSGPFLNSREMLR